MTFYLRKYTGFFQNVFFSSFEIDWGFFFTNLQQSNVLAGQKKCGNALAKSHARAHLKH